MRHWLIPLALLAVIYASAGIARVAGILFLAASALLWHAERIQARGKKTDREVLPLQLNIAKDEVPSEAVLLPELELLVSFVVRDFISTWHTGIARGAGDAFPTATRHLIQVALERLVRRARGMDMTRVIVARIVPTVRLHVESFFRATARMRLLNAHMADEAHARELLAELQRVEHFLPTHYNDGVLHMAVGNISSMHTRESEHAALRRICERLLRGILPPGSTGPLSWVLVREAIGCAVLYPLVDMVTSPDVLNAAIANAAEAAVHRHASVERLRASLEQQNNTSPLAQTAHREVPDSPTRNVRKGPRQLSSLLKQINTTDSLIELRRIRSDIVLHLQRAKAQKLDSSRQASYISKLERALYNVDARIEQLGRQPESAQLADVNAALEHTSLDHVLLSPSGLSYFMEFMERRKRSVLIQFWVMVNTFKDPLEDADVEFGAKISTDLLHRSKDGVFDEEAATIELKDALRIIISVYYSSPFLTIKEQYVRVAQEFLEIEHPTVKQRYIVRQSVLCAQADVFEEMRESDFGPFKQSALFLQAVEHVPNTSAPGTVPTTPIMDDWSDYFSSDYARQEHSDPERSHPTRIPQHYGFLMGTGGGKNSSHDTGGRVSLFGSDPLFDDVEPPGDLQLALHEIINDEEAESWQFKPVRPRQTATGADALRVAFKKDTENAGHKMPEDAEGQSTPRAARATGKTFETRLEYLDAHIAKLKEHHDLLNTMINKAELTGTTRQDSEVLIASRNAINRDMRQALWESEHLKRQMQQLGQCGTVLRLQIASTDVQFDAALGRNYVAFHVLVETSQGTHTISRRYSEFRSLHQSLKQRYPQTWTLDTLFPGRRLVGMLSASFIETRRRALERYLQAIIRVPELENSTELRMFLADNTGAHKHFGPDVAAAPMYDIAVQELQEERKTSQSRFTEPICDLLVELFDLKQRVDWLRRNAIMLVLQVVLGGAIERVIRDATTRLVNDSSIRALASSLTNALWPGGARFASRPRPIPTPKERLDTWLRMHHALHAIVPAYTESVVGRDSARSGARKLLLIAQNQRLNKHLVYTILDILVDELLQVNG
ncbi:tRNA (guanine-N(7)-)-methyltransferase (tRNA(m7G46)-methyltransferase) [Malassezia cuniculi]|uniref:tRNA (Guanine-N(7)-)-methyltransferase (tRNA(m7G46)-methyltransferase) n=1 Tax=Malassezia cuniculi TaxID=948313 RepID=A0AAF0EVS9_9BASI|nr:tRNA (guanine-N(7)-)-methyltransferase (tRNA(m7G46)-methyltransferase) [Malassezia cuniculi]